MQTRPQPAHHAFSTLPIELFLHVLDQLVNTRTGHPPIALAPTDPTTQALRALTLVSRAIYPIASRYLYTHCLYLDNCTSFARFRRTLGLPLWDSHPEALAYGQAGRNEALFVGAGVPRYLTALFLSPHRTRKCGNAPMVRLPQVIDLCGAVGATLRRLAMDLGPVYASPSEVEAARPLGRDGGVLGGMVCLEEMVCSFDVADCFPDAPPNLKRLAITSQGLRGEEALVRFCFGVLSLEVLVFLRPAEMEAADVNVLFEKYMGRHLDVVLVDVNANHVTPEWTRDWTEEDRVTVWEVDVPKSYYGDDEDLILCDHWLWTHGVRGTLFTQEKRRMESWSQARAKSAIV